MLGFAALAEVALAEIPGLSIPAPITAPKAGWFEGWDKPRRRIPLELLREVLREQGSPWGEELQEAVAAIQIVARTTKSKKLRKTLDTVIEKVQERASIQLGWDHPLDMLRIIARLSRTTQALKYAEQLVAFFEGEEEEEELILLTYDG